ncbi:MAG: type IV pilus modification PilV family protein [Gemmatimonadaceae bacterium]
MRSHSFRFHPPRAGFTLIELMVAIMVLAVGVLGLASTAAVVTRQMGGGMMQSRAATVAMSRFERLHAVGCTTLGGTTGTASARGVTESWFAVDTTRAVIVIDSVAYATPRGRRLHFYRSTIPCPALP